MHRLTTRSIRLGLLAVLACGAPAELGEGFPGDYAGDDTGSVATGGGPIIGAGGTTSAAGVANAPAASAGTGTAGASSAPPPVASIGGTGNAAQPPAGSEAPPPPPAQGGAIAGGCPDDITVLFDRPVEQGGCAGAPCHEPNATAPDLVSPNVLDRLLNQPSGCAGRPYIGADDSFLADKIAGSPPECGLAMPFFMPQALSADDEACILAWIDEVSGG